MWVFIGEPIGWRLRKEITIAVPGAAARSSHDHAVTSWVLDWV